MKRKASERKEQPVCSECGGEGRDVQFSISSPHGFGTYCVECEKNIDAVATMRKVVVADQAETSRRGDA